MFDPPDLSDQYNTALTPQQEAMFQVWANHAGRQRDTFDYDLRGAWLANAQQAMNGHLPDTFKKPNHPTFSSESQYNNVDGHEGGQWVQQGSRWQFMASPHNVDNLTARGLKLYFRHAEPDAVLMLPELPTTVQK